MDALTLDEMETIFRRWFQDIKISNINIVSSNVRRRNFRQWNIPVGIFDVSLLAEKVVFWGYELSTEYRDPERTNPRVVLMGPVFDIASFEPRNATHMYGYLSTFLPLKKRQVPDTESITELIRKIDTSNTSLSIINTTLAKILDLLTKKL